MPNIDPTQIDSPEKMAAYVSQIQEEAATEIVRLETRIAAVQASGATAEALAALQVELQTVKSVLAEVEVKGKGPGFGGAEQQSRPTLAQFLLDNGVSEFIEGKKSGEITHDKTGDSNIKMSVDFGKVFDRQGLKSRHERVGAIGQMMRSHFAVHGPAELQALHSGREDETGGSLVHRQPEFIEEGLIRVPIRPTSVLSVLGVRSTDRRRHVFNRVTREMAMVAVSTLQVASGAGPHTLTVKGGRDAWINLTTTDPAGDAWKLIVRHVNSVEESSLTYTTLAARHTDVAEGDAGHFTIGVTGTLAANFEVNDILILARSDDGTLVNPFLPVGIGEGDIMAVGKIVTAEVTRHASKFPMTFHVPGEILEDEEAFEDEIQTTENRMRTQTIPRQVFQGAGSGAADQDELLGILNVTGILTQVKVGGENNWDTIIRGVAQIRNLGHVGTIAVFISPNAGRDMRLEKDLDDNYLIPPELGDVELFEDAFIDDADDDIGVCVAAGAYEIWEWGSTRFAMTQAHGENFDKDITSLRFIPWFLTKDKQATGICSLDFSP